MGIRFQCHLCNHSLHVKDFQAGKRGKCPKCEGSFRIPQGNSSVSTSIDELSKSDSAIVTPVRNQQPTVQSVATPKSKPKSKETSATLDSQSKAGIVSKSVPAATEGSSVSQVNAAPSKAKPQASSSKVAPTKSENSPTQRESIPKSTPIPSSLLPFLEARWFVRPPNGGQYGPATTPLLVDWIAERRVTHDSYLWREGTENWQPAIEVVPEAFLGLSASPKISSDVSTQPLPVNTVIDDLLEVSSPGSLAASKASVAIKRRKQQTQQWIVLGLLVVIALSLTGTLFYILFRK